MGNLDQLPVVLGGAATEFKPPAAVQQKMGGPGATSGAKSDTVPTEPLMGVEPDLNRPPKEFPAEPNAVGELWRERMRRHKANQAQYAMIQAGFRTPFWQWMQEEMHRRLSVLRREERSLPLDPANFGRINMLRAEQDVYEVLLNLEHLSR